ncbi:hypothetical protein GCM10028784_29610 [Myceligenerans cantabricum]
MRIYRATEDDVPLLYEIRNESVAWLATLGTDQWSSHFPTEETMLKGFAEAARSGTVWLVDDADGPLATVTLDTVAEPVLWTTEEIAEPARYVHRLTVRRRAAGVGLGSEILNWCGNRAYHEGARWLRLDAWTTNTALHRYYLDEGFTHVRTRALPDYPSGALFQRPAAPAVTPRLHEGG